MLFIILYKEHLVYFNNLEQIKEKIEKGYNFGCNHDYIEGNFIKKGIEDFKIINITINKLFYYCYQSCKFMYNNRNNILQLDINDII